MALFQRKTEQSYTDEQTVREADNKRGRAPSFEMRRDFSEGKDLRSDDDAHSFFEKPSQGDKAKPRGRLRITNQEARREYIENCLQQMYEGARELEELKLEYNEVSGLIDDMDTMNALSPESHDRIRNYARRITTCEDMQLTHTDRKHVMSDSEYARMERMEGEMETGVRKFRSAEEYNRKIRNDLRRLENEKEAFYMREDDLEKTLGSTHDLSVLVMIALVVVLAVLFILQMALQYNVVYGYIAAVTLAAVTIVVQYTKNNAAVKELKKIDGSINRLILLQNTVKIRYVNNRNLLDYYCMKYGVGKSTELKKMMAGYEKEKKARLKMSDTEKELNETRHELFRMLSGGRFKYPEKWVRMPEVILSRQDEMAYRRELMSRRKQLRDRMDYNQERVTQKAKDEIKRLAGKYPQYADEISDQVDLFIKEKGIRF